MSGTLEKADLQKLMLKGREIWKIVLDTKQQATGTVDILSLNIATNLALWFPKIFTKDAFEGEITSVETVPGANGDLTTNAGSAIHITLKDPYGFDIMEGSLYNRSSTLAERVYADPPVTVNTELQLNIASMRTWPAGQERIIIWMEH